MKVVFDWRLYVKYMADACDDFADFKNYISHNVWTESVDGKTIDEIDEMGYVYRNDWLKIVDQKGK